MAKKNVKSSVENQVEVNETSNANLSEGLGTDETQAPKEQINYSSREYLENTVAHFPEAVTSAKFDIVREPKVQNGLGIIEEFMGESINPLILLLAKWWENKPARAEIKKMIDAEAAEKGIASDNYLQVDLRENVEKLSQIQNAIDRMKYSINYFKPRAGLSNKVISKQVNLRGEIYSVPMNKLVEIKEQFPNKESREEMIDAIIAISVKVELECL